MKNIILTNMKLELDVALWNVRNYCEKDRSITLSILAFLMIKFYLSQYFCSNFVNP